MLISASSIHHHHHRSPDLEGHWEQDGGPVVSSKLRKDQIRLSLSWDECESVSVGEQTEA